MNKISRYCIYRFNAIFMVPTFLMQIRGKSCDYPVSLAKGDFDLINAVDFQLHKKNCFDLTGSGCNRF